MRLRVAPTLTMAAGAVVVALATLAGCSGPAPEPAAPSSSPAEAQGPPAVSPTLERIRSRKKLRCGVTDSTPGFSERNLTGQWHGFDVDLCRAAAAAVLGDARAVSIVGLNSRTRFAALQSGAVDLLAGGGSDTFTHDVVFGLDFVGVSYYDSLGFLAAAPRAPRRADAAAPTLKTIADLNGARICVQGGSAAQQALAEGLKARGLSYQPIVKDNPEQSLAAYQRRQCDAIVDDLSVLAHDRSALRDPERHEVLTETLADEPFGPVVREGDDRWSDVVRWTLNALVLAEAGKLNSRTVDVARRDSVDPQVRRLLGAEGDAGRRLGLADDWAFRVIRQVGSYDEIFDRNLGPNSELKLDRGRNALWNADKPGQIYAPPIR